MARKLGLAVCYGLAIVYILSIALPAVYCLRHGCKGPGELDAFMPAFMFTFPGAIATALCLSHTLQRIRKRGWPWLFWPLAILFSIILFGVAVLVGLIVYHTVFHRAPIQ